MKVSYGLVCNMYLASLFSPVDMIDLHIVTNLKDGFSHDEAHIDQYGHFHIQ